MRAVYRVAALAALALLAAIGPASAWWKYAEWGLSESQLRAASSGQAIPCRPDAPACAATATGLPKLFIPSTEMLGMPASVAFTFDGDGHLSETTVLFSDADFALIGNLVQGIHGLPVEDRPGTVPVRVWRDAKRGSILTATPSGTGTKLSYRPGGPG